MIGTGVGFELAVMDARAAILLIVGGQDFAPASSAGQWNLVILPCFAGEVDHDDQLLVLRADAHEA